MTDKREEAVRRCLELTRQYNDMVDQSQELLARSTEVAKEVDEICEASGIDWATEIDHPFWAEARATASTPA
jgi:hypothetical protein